MPQTTSIRILEHDNNRRGDLFGRLMADLFVALGYQFTETAIEQEKCRSTKIVLLAGPQVVEELVKGRILISKGAGNGSRRQVLCSSQ